MGAFLAGLLLGAALGAGGAVWVGRRRRQALGRFLAFAGHELNSPLTAVMMTGANLIGGVFGSEPEQQKPWLELLHEQVARLAGLVGELRDFVHLEFGGDLAVYVEDQPVREVVDAAVRSIRSGLLQAKIPLEIALEEGLPAVSGDPERTARTLASLLYHARKFRVEGPIRLSARAQDGGVFFDIEFEAPALSAAQAAQSLDMLYLAHGPREVLKATGLGLGLLRALLERQGGGLSLSVDGRRQRLSMRAAVAGNK